MTLRDVLDDLAGYLENEIEEGTSHAVVSASVLDDLKRLATRPPSKPAAAPASAAARSAVPRAAPEPVRPSPPAAVRAAAPAAAPAPDGSGKALAAIAREIAGCTKCGLHATRTKTVPGQGKARPRVVFVGEAPGADEDLSGLAFVGAAGQLLTKMIVAMGLTRDDVFICNVVKCRPPANRKPELGEMAACLPYLKRQIEALQPEAIVALGATALTGLSEEPLPEGISRMRGKWLSFQGIAMMPTFHPAYLLRNASVKKYAWQDLQSVMKRLKLPMPPAAGPRA